MDLANWTGFLGGVAGLAALVMQGYDVWKRRRPVLRLWVPFCFVGTHASSKQRVLFALIRISNTSERPAYLYLETLRAHVYLTGGWHEVGVLAFPGDTLVNTDLPETARLHAGIEYIKAFSRFDNAVVSLDTPFSRYLGLTSADAELTAAPGRLRVSVKDCNLVAYELEADIQASEPPHAL